MKKYKIGYTTGVFDMFHIGHLNLLQRAKERCDCLIVGVSTDEITLSYKGKKPIVPFEERLAIVGALRCVDKVVAQKTMDKITAWEKYHYQALFHGSDWKDTEMYRMIEEELSKKGAEVVFLPHTRGTSSTILAEKLRRLEE